VTPETSWSYDLNPLVRQCVNSRALAVWQALAEVARGLDSFFFTPSAELHFAHAINGAAKKEVDVLCVSDGKLLLGEVKEGTLHGLSVNSPLGANTASASANRFDCASSVARARRILAKQSSSAARACGGNCWSCSFTPEGC
jgi:hypothetical protein